jgi:hypothetical protein
MGQTPAERTEIIVSNLKFETLYGTKVSFTQGIWNGRSGVYDEDRLKVINVPDLNILDAIWVNARPGRGPSASYDEADFTGIILSGVDPAALDAWAESVQ